MGDKITTKQVKSSNKTSTNVHQNKKSDNSKNAQPFRGTAIHIKEDGTTAVELVGITPMELYGVLNFVIEKVRKQLDGN